MDEFPNNSRAAKSRKDAPSDKANEKKVEKVVTHKVVQRKLPLGKRIAQTFIGGDNQSVGQYIVMDVLVPATKDMIHDVVTSYVERMLFPDSAGSAGRRRRSGSPIGSSVGKFNYGTSSTSIRRDPREDPRRAVSKNRKQVGEIILETRVEAEEVLERMFEQIRDYDSVSVADLYDMIDFTSDFTDNKWGWYDLAGARIRHLSREGYLLELPRPVPLD